MRLVVVVPAVIYTQLAHSTAECHSILQTIVIIANNDVFRVALAILWDFHYLRTNTCIEEVANEQSATGREAWSTEEDVYVCMYSHQMCVHVCS